MVSSCLVCGRSDGRPLTDGTVAPDVTDEHLSTSIASASCDPCVRPFLYPLHSIRQAKFAADLVLLSVCIHNLDCILFNSQQINSVNNLNCLIGFKWNLLFSSSIEINCHDNKVDTELSLIDATVCLYGSANTLTLFFTQNDDDR